MGDRGEGKGDCLDEGNEGVPAPPWRWPTEYDESKVEGRWTPEPPLEITSLPEKADGSGLWLGTKELLLGVHDERQVLGASKLSRDSPL